MIFKRNIKENLEKSLKRSPVVLLTGPRQSGKTFLVKEIAKEHGYSYITFDDIQTLSLAKGDPSGFINNLGEKVILDEIQRVPELFLSIKKNVDENRVPGKFLLTGSANPLLIPNLGDSLVGRMEIFYLYPFSQGELINKTDSFIDQVFSSNIKNINVSKIPPLELYNKISTGGFPLVQNLDNEGKDAWFSGYITTLLERDIKDLIKITDFIDFPKLLNILALRISGLVNFADLGRESSLVTTTLKRYLSLLQTLYLIKFNLPWFSNIGLRFVKSPKLYFTDTGLLSHILDLTAEKIMKNSNLSGKILENFVTGELWKQATWNKTKVRIYHLRDHSGNEVDIILENSKGQIIGIEVKSSEGVSAKDFKHLKLLQEKMPQKFLAGIVLYAGENTIPAGDNLFAVPINALWK